MRTLLAVLLLTPAVALGAPGDATADSAVASSPAGLITKLDSADIPPSQLDAVRLFNTTEVFHLEPSDVRAELRGLGDVPNVKPTLEVHAEVGLTSHFQLSLSEDLMAVGGSIQPSATPIGLRYSLAWPRVSGRGS